jgi:hypothetical protein
MKTYTIRTDADMYDDVEADSIDAAIDQATEFSDLAELARHIERHADDGAWLWIDCDGERIVEIGNPS